MSTKHWSSTWWGVALSIGLVSELHHSYWGVTAMSMNIALPDELPVSTAQLNFTFKDPIIGKTVIESQTGHYAVISPIHHEYGKLVHVFTDDEENHGCQPFINAPKFRWIALIRRGGCKFHDKIVNAMVHNASAVIVYNNNDEEDLLVMEHFIDRIVSVFIHQKDGLRLAELVDGGVDVNMNITLQDVTVYDIRETVTGKDQERHKVQPLLIISVSLIGCLITALSILLAYGIRRAKARRKKTRRHIVFTVNDVAQHQRLLLRDLPETIVEPNNNDPNHNVYNTPYHPQ